MISGAGQLGTGALWRGNPGEISGVAKGEVRSFAERHSTKIPRLGEIGGWVVSRGRVSGTPALEFGARIVGGMLSGAAHHFEGSQGPREASSGGHDLGTGPSTVDVLDSIESRPRDWFYAGSFALRAVVRSVSHDVDVLNQMRARRNIASSVAGSSTPYVSVIWTLVQAQQLRKARSLLKLVPDSSEHAKLSKLLSAPVTSASSRKDFDRSAEYHWLTQNAKNYVGRWVAVSGKNLLATARTLKELREELKKTQAQRPPLLHYVE